MKFTLTIEMGNDAVQTAEDIAGILDDTSQGIRDDGELISDFKFSVRDANGNTVGHWMVTDE
jgi:hypothetical protein